MDELEILKKEMASLKHNLAKETIINERLLQTVMKGRVSWLNNLVKISFIFIPVAWLMLASISAFYHISQWYGAVFVILAIFDSLADLRTFRISPVIFSKYSMMEVRTLLIKQKKERLIHFVISLTLCLTWVFFFIAALYKAAVGESLGIAAIIGGIVGIVIAVPVVFFLYRKAQKTSDSLLSDLNMEVEENNQEERGE